MTRVISLMAICLMIVSQLSFSQTIDKRRALSYFNQGYIYYMEGSYNEAIPEFFKALQYNPNLAKAYYWIGKTHYRTKHYSSSLKALNKAIAIIPDYSDAISLRAKVRRALSLSAASTAQTAPKEEISTANRTVISNPTPTQSTPKKKTISLDLRNVDISTILEIFSRETGISIIAGRDVYGKITVVLNNADPDEALDSILKSNGFTYVREGNIVHVFSSGEPPRIEELPGGIFVRTFIINYIGPEELKETLSKLMPDATNIYTTKGSNTVVVRGSANDIRRAEALIRNIDIPPRQVMVEAKIIEVSVNEAQNLGVNAQYTNPNNATEVGQTVGLANTPTSTGARGLYYTVTNQNLTVLVEALSTRTGFNILSSPKVMALNEQTAEIITGSRLGYKVKTVTTTGMVESVEFLDVGTKLVITPSIKSDGLIVMEIHPEISEGAIVNELPQKNSTETTTKLIVKDSQTIVIGGLIRDTSKKEVKGIPVLMDIPVIGMFFKRSDLTSEKKEVIVLITPHIMNSRSLGAMEEKINSMEKRKYDIAPAMTLDLVR